MSDEAGATTATPAGGAASGAPAAPLPLWIVGELARPSATGIRPSAPPPNPAVPLDVPEVSVAALVASLPRGAS